MTGPTRPWWCFSGELVQCPNCAAGMPILLGTAVSVQVRVHPGAAPGDGRKYRPTESDVSAMFHHACQTALELRFIGAKAAAA